MATDKIEVISTEFINPIMDSQDENPPPPPIRARNQSWITDHSVSISDHQKMKMVRRRRIRQPKPYLLRVKIAGLNNFYRAKSVYGKLFWSLLVVTAMSALAYMLARLFYARFFPRPNLIKASLFYDRELERISYPKMSVCVKPTVTAGTVRRILDIPKINNTNIDMRDESAEIVGTYMTLAWLDFWDQKDMDAYNRFLQGSKHGWARKVFLKNFPDDGDAFVRFLYRNSAPQCQSLLANCRMDKNAFPCCHAEIRMQEEVSLGQDPSRVFNKNGRCYQLDDLSTLHPGLENGLQFDIREGENTNLIFNDWPSLAPIPLPNGSQVMISLKTRTYSIKERVQFRRFNHTCLDECIAKAVEVTCGCKSLATSSRQPLVNENNASITWCTPTMEYSCAERMRGNWNLCEMNDEDSTAYCDLHLQKLAIIQHLIQHTKIFPLALCGRCSKTTDDPYEELRLEPHVTVLSLYPQNQSIAADAKTRVSVFFPTPSMEMREYKSTDRVWLDSWRIRGLLALFGGMSVISFVQAIYYALLALITRRCAPAPKPVKLTTVINHARPVQNAPNVVVTGDIPDDQPGVSGLQSSNENTVNDASLATGSAKRRSTSIVAWMPADVDQHRPCSARRNTTMATYLNKIIALPYTDDEPIKEKTRVDAVVSLNPKQNSSVQNSPLASSSRRSSIQICLDKISSKSKQYIADSTSVEAIDGPEIQMNPNPIRRISMPSLSVSRPRSIENTKRGLPSLYHSNKITSENGDFPKIPNARTNGSSELNHLWNSLITEETSPNQSPISNETATNENKHIFVRPKLAKIQEASMETMDDVEMRPVVRGWLDECGGKKNRSLEGDTYRIRRTSIFMPPDEIDEQEL